MHKQFRGPGELTTAAPLVKDRCEPLEKRIADTYIGKLHPRIGAGLAPLLNLQFRATHPNYTYDRNGSRIAFGQPTSRLIEDEEWGSRWTVFSSAPDLADPANISVPYFIV